VATGLASFGTKVCEASDDNGNFHVHVRLDESGTNTNPDLKTILTRNASKVEDGLQWKAEKVNGAY
jgi:hypothetical protein